MGSAVIIISAIKTAKFDKFRNTVNLYTNPNVKGVPKNVNKTIKNAILWNLSIPLPCKSARSGKCWLQAKSWYNKKKAINTNKYKYIVSKGELYKYTIIDQ